MSVDNLVNVCVLGGTLVEFNGDFSFCSAELRNWLETYKIFKVVGYTSLSLECEPISIMGKGDIKLVDRARFKLYNSSDILVEDSTNSKLDKLFQSFNTRKED